MKIPGYVAKAVVMVVLNNPGGPKGNFGKGEFWVAIDDLQFLFDSRRRPVGR